MKCLIISDVHGNLPALEKVLEHAGTFDHLINLGDVVNYGPWSNECVELIESIEGKTNILGNHEGYFIKQDCDCPNDLVKRFYEFSSQSFLHLKLIEQYQESGTFKGVSLSHTIGSGYVYSDTGLSIKGKFFIGHSHEQFLRNEKELLLLNPGSVGQNRKRIHIAEYAIWDTEDQSYDLRSVEYNFDLLINEFESRNYPKECIDYYLKKYRK